MRCIPFGYEILDGAIQVLEKEAEVVRNIYALYVQGLSLKNISERLNQSTITYANDGRQWDKNMVKRILENKKYIGDKSYPAIITKELSKKVLKIKDNKYQGVDDAEKLKLDTYRKKNVCAICGSKMKRSGSGARKKIRKYWQCSNTECDGNHHIFHEYKLDKLVADITNMLAENLEMTEHTVTPKFEKDIEVIRLANEVDEIMDTPTSIATDVIEKIMKLASVKLSKCTIGDNTGITKTIKAALAIHPKSETVDGKIIGKIVEKIKMYPNDTICIELINGKTIMGKSDTNECGI